MNAEEKNYEEFLENDTLDFEEEESFEWEREEKRGAVGGKRLTREIAKGVLFAVLAYFLGACELPFGAQPFGIALLCAADKKIPYIFTGVCLSTIGADKPSLMLCAYVAALIIRVLSRLLLDPPRADDSASGALSFSATLDRIFSENVFLRMATSCVAAFIVSLYALVSGGFLYYDLYGALIGILIAPSAVILLNGLFNERVSAEDNFRYFSAALLATLGVFAVRNATLWGVSVAAFASTFLTLYVTRKKGMTAGVAVAILCGLAYSPIYAPSFIFAALAAGALWRVSQFFASMAAFSVGFAWGIYVKGIGAVTALMPAMLGASLIFAVLDKLFFSASAVSAESTKADERGNENENENESACISDASLLSSARLEGVRQKTQTMRDTFFELSKFFFELGERTKKPLVCDTKQICDNAFDACCTGCRHKELCWEENYSETLAAVSTISAAVHKNREVRYDDVPEKLRGICERLPDITDEINHNYALHTRQLLLCDKTEIFALDYEAMAELLASSIDEEEGEFEYDAELSHALCERISAALTGVFHALIYGKEKKQIRIFGASKEVLKGAESTIVNIAASLTGESFQCESIDESEGGVAVMKLSRARRFSVEFAKISMRAREEENFCGDTVSIFEGDGDKFYSFISDGMGSGRDAALTSGICAMFMEKMLSAGNRCDTSLRMLNGFLRNKGGGSMHECSATVDLFELDMISGKAAFYKSGAAPTYVFRDGSVFKLRSKTVPVGIIRELDAKKISFDVGNGDVIVMVSDGVTEGKEECPWLFELLKKNLEGEGVRHTAELIAERARCENGNDDISVVVIKINDVLEA